MEDLATIQANTGIPLVPILQHIDELLLSYSDEPPRARGGQTLQSLSLSGFPRLYGEGDGWYRYPYEDESDVVYIGVKDGKPQLKLSYKQGRLVEIEEYRDPVRQKPPGGSLYWNDRAYPVRNYYGFSPVGQHYANYDVNPTFQGSKFSANFEANRVETFQRGQPMRAYPWNGQ